jgi:hypothetical protein
MQESDQLHTAASLLPEKKHYIGRSVGPRAGPEALEKKQFLPLPGVTVCGRSDSFVSPLIALTFSPLLTWYTCVIPQQSAWISRVEAG